MKLKIRFLELLCPFQKQNTTDFQTPLIPRERNQNKYIIALLTLWLIVMIFGVLRCKAQERPILKIGDKVPDVVFTNIMNSHSKSIKLSDFKGKLVLVDFWATWCSSCIAAFPELDSLQRSFPNKLEILLVNSQKQHNSEKSVQMVIDRVNAWSTHRLKLPIVFQDTAITRYILFTSVPTCAWISPDSRLLAVTGDDQVTVANIELIINGETVPLRSNKEYTNH
jgi:thiol-disulfide isomerase/thioredoxin